MVLYESFIDKKSPEEPKYENIAKELEKRIAEIEKTNHVELVSACFLGEHDVQMKGEEDSIFSYAVMHDKKHDYMLFFRKISREKLC